MNDIYLLISNLILNLAVVLGTIFVHKPLTSSEPTEAADPDLKPAVNMTPKSPTVRDPDPVPPSSQHPAPSTQFHPAPSTTTHVHTIHNNATLACLPLFFKQKISNRFCSGIRKNITFATGGLGCGSSTYFSR